MTNTERAALHAACFLDTRAWTAEEFAALNEDQNCFILEQSAGLAVGRLAADEVELLTLAVHPEHRREGIGRTILAGFLDAALACGAKTCFLEVDENNHVARALYDRAGFTQAGLRKDYYRGANGQKSSALVLRKQLS